MKRVFLPTTLPHYSVDSSGNTLLRPREKLLERLPATVDRDAALNELQERLAGVTELFLHHGDGGRAGVSHAMRHVITYLTSQGIPQATLLPIEAVMAAIVDANNGTASPIFQPRRSNKGGAPPKPVMQTGFEGKLAIVMECCVRHCQAEGQRPFVEPAARLATRLINKSAWPVQVTPKRLREIRERVRQRKGFAYDRVQVEHSMSTDLARAKPLEWAKLLLSHEWVNPPPKVSD